MIIATCMKFKKAEAGSEGQTNLRETPPVVSTTGDSAGVRSLRGKPGALARLLFGSPGLQDLTSALWTAEARGMCWDGRCAGLHLH